MRVIRNGAISGALAYIVALTMAHNGFSAGEIFGTSTAIGIVIVVLL